MEYIILILTIALAIVSYRLATVSKRALKYKKLMNDRSSDWFYRMNNAEMQLANAWDSSKRWREKHKEAMRLAKRNKHYSNKRLCK